MSSALAFERVPSRIVFKTADRNIGAGTVRSLDILAEAIGVAQRLREPENSAALGAIAIAYAQIQQFERALQLVEAIDAELPRWRDSGFISRKNPSQSLQDFVRSRIAVEYARTGAYEQALQVVQTIENQPIATIIPNGPNGYIDPKRPRVETASTNGKKDYEAKYQEYASMGIPEYWMINSRREHIWVCNSAAPGNPYTYREFGKGERIVSTVLPGLELTADEVLNPPLVSDLIDFEQTERDALAAQNAKITTERDVLAAEKAEIQQQLEQLKALIAEKGLDPSL